ncbi:GH3 domain-containing protein isoform X1 [Tachysurus fulvidraco]|uniref:GH3 domain-containing protein isoform X1 n=2 Tax=Tachysurus fulvidraco TaxID=1234273 RepID=UPI001FF06EB7|nr:GH3 domain-containing protein isoform X1 [Tachysurus fulvidraco]
MNRFYGHFTAMGCVWCAVVGCGVMAVLTAGAFLSGMMHGVFVALCAVALSIAAALYVECVRADRRSVCSVVRHYLSVWCVSRAGRNQRDALERDTLNVRRAQEETLLRRLRDTKHTRYGLDYHFDSITDTTEFRKCHPITTYKHYEELIRQVASGEKKAIVMGAPILTMTSGSSGCSKMLLNTKETNSDYFLQGISVCVDVMRKSFPETTSLQTKVRLFYPMAERYSEAGVQIVATPFSSVHTLHGCTSPPAILEVQNEHSALYLHLLFALRDRHVGILESRFSCVVFDAFRLLEEHWEDLADDVESGRISSRIVLDAWLRSKLEKGMKPDPVRGDELRTAISKGFEGIALRLWPRLHLIHTVDSGPHQIYGESLRQHYCRGVPFYSPLYATTEGLIGVNLWPLQESRRYLLCPRSMFFEFLPEEHLDAQHGPNTQNTLSTLLMDEVKEGKNYELVVTNASGLFRYRLGDVVKVVTFHNQCPVVEFLYRLSETLNIRGEKVNEALFLAALKKAVTQWPGAKLVDYCCAESGILGDSSGGAQPHYQVFLELSGVRNLTEEQRYKLDMSLQADCAIYKSFRIKGSVGQMRVQLVSKGAFQELKSYMVSFCHTSRDMFQMQRVIRKKEYADFLLRKTVS